MKVLPCDFTYKKYGVRLRLITESDAPFIVELRTNPKLSKYIHKTSNDIQEQINWIEQYKTREAKGLEYYFLVSCEQKPVGLIRIYSIHDKTFTIGSMLMSPDSPIHCVLGMSLCINEIAFEVLNLELDDSYDGVCVNNKAVLKFNISWGKEEYRRYFVDNDEYISLKLTKANYLKAKPKMIKKLALLLPEQIDTIF